MVTEEQYNIKYKTLYKEFIKKVKHLNHEIGLENNPYNVGDIIEDHYHIIQIETISVRGSDSGHCIPDCIYYGIELKKDLTPKKRQTNLVMYQCNVKRKIERKL